jgi:hypothetical protein
MPQEDMKRQMGGEPVSSDARDGQAAYDAGRRQFGDEPRRHVDAGHGTQRTYSPRAIAADGTYVGHAGGYVGSHGGAGSREDSTYGYPYGQGIGLVGERHPDDEAATLGGVGMDSTDFGPGDRFGAGRNADWRTAPFDPGFRDAEYMELRNAHGRRLEADYRALGREHGRSFAQMLEDWRARRRAAAPVGDAGAPREDDSGF